MDYSKTSDFEINLNVAYKLYAAGVVNKVLIPDTPNKVSGVQLIHKGEWCWFDPCNNPADAWPIIQRNGISIVKYGHGMWLASSDAYWVDGVEWQIDGENHPNPLRAAMIVFLQMQGK